jgi:hypothetical protein
MKINDTTLQTSAFILPLLDIDHTRKVYLVNLLRIFLVTLGHPVPVVNAVYRREVCTDFPWKPVVV